MLEFAHERLDVYQAAIDFLTLSEVVAEQIPRGRAYLVDQLRRAALSVPLNIAEGAGEFSPGDKARFYRIARRSATECVATMDASRVLQLANNEDVRRGRELLFRIVSMLTALILRLTPNEP